MNHKLTTGDPPRFGPDRLSLICDTIKKLLCLTQEGDQLTIVRAEGNFNKIIDNFLDSELSDDFEFFRELNDEEVDEDRYPETEIAVEVAHNSTRPD